MKTAPNQRSFSLNSDEAYETLCPREDRPWIMAGSLPREPRVWEGEVVVEKRQAGRVAAASGEWED